MKRTILSFDLVLVLTLGLWSVAGQASAKEGADSPGHSLAPSACTSPRFGPATNYPAGNNPYSVAVGDFNRDGNPDLVAANRGNMNDGNDISILMGNGSGGFGPPTNFLAGTHPRAVAVGDFNNDLNPDLAVVNQSSGGVSALLGDGTGGFGPPTYYATGPSPLAVAVGDFNRDSKPDLAVANGNGPSGSVSVLLGDGSGGFSPATNFAIGVAPWSIAVGDFNRDTKLDLVTANLNGDTVSVLLGDGNGGFGAATLFVVDEPASVAVGDFNRDGKLDLAVAKYASDNAAILLGNGSGGFSSAPNVGMGHLPFSIATADFNSDGKLDLVTANEGTLAGSNNISVALGKGNGRFNTRTNFGGGATPVSVAVGDFNGDGKPDLATANRFGGTSGNNNVSVLLNTCP